MRIGRIDLGFPISILLQYLVPVLLSIIKLPHIIILPIPLLFHNFLEIVFLPIKYIIALLIIRLVLPVAPRQHLVHRQTRDDARLGHGDVEEGEEAD